MNAIHLLDNVKVTPTGNSGQDAQFYDGQIGTVYHKDGDELAVVFSNGVRLLLSIAEVERVGSVAEKMMNRAPERHWRERAMA